MLSLSSIPFLLGAQVSFGAHVLLVFSISPYVTLVGRITEERTILGTIGSAELFVNILFSKAKQTRITTMYNDLVDDEVGLVRTFRHRKDSGLPVEFLLQLIWLCILLLAFETFGVILNGSFVLLQ